MKKKIKDLTLNDCRKICKKKDAECQGCPLCSVCYTLGDRDFCNLDDVGIELNKEIEVK